jgi:hypothetical protein
MARLFDDMGVCLLCHCLAMDDVLLLQGSVYWLLHSNNFFSWLCYSGFQPLCNNIFFEVGCLMMLLMLRLYRVIQEELPPLMELISEDILSKKCHINLGPILDIYRVTIVRNCKRTTVNCAFGDGWRTLFTKGSHKHVRNYLLASCTLLRKSEITV